MYIYEGTMKETPIFRCVHSVFCPDADWRLQDRNGVPVTARVSWGCWCCRPYGLDFDEVTLLRFARANQVGRAWPAIHFADTVDAVDGEDDAPDLEAEFTEAQAVLAGDMAA